MGWIWLSAAASRPSEIGGYRGAHDRQGTRRDPIGNQKSPSVLVSRRRTAVPVVRPEGRLPGVIAKILRNRLSMSALVLKLRIQKSSGSVKKKRKLLTHKR